LRTVKIFNLNLMLVRLSPSVLAGARDVTSDTLLAPLKGGIVGATSPQNVTHLSLKERRQKHFLSQERIIIAALYVLLLAGGLWHVLGVFQTAMRILATPMIVGICLLVCYEYLKTQGSPMRVNEGEQSERKAGERCSRNRQFILWSVAVIFCGFFIELIGVKSGVIFGSYVYGNTLQPQFWNVPLAIGFAWLSILLGATAVAQRILPAFRRMRPLFLSAIIALLMALFDAFMEPAAMKLGYWHWSDGEIPFRNFIAWFVFGLMLAFGAARWRAITPPASTISLHAYLAQLGYLIIVHLA